ncbi:MAG: DUF3047 domain-containing protein [Planctomycetes bacterium]|nr:DUF3047 domain-containing protein [Planctomycetota bacterium]
MMRFRSAWLALLAVSLAAGAAMCCAVTSKPAKSVPSADARDATISILNPSMPTDWRHRVLDDRRPVAYRPRREEERAHLRATSVSAASMLVRYLRFDAAKHPDVSWEWRVTAPAEDRGRRAEPGADASARVMFGFQGDWSGVGFFERREVMKEIEKTGHEPPGSLLVYLWSLDLAEGAAFDDPHLGKRAKVIVATAGKERIGSWDRVKRDLASDYRRAFGTDPPPVVSVALMTDTDDTGSSAVADYGTIEASRR